MFAKVQADSIDVMLSLMPHPAIPGAVMLHYASSVGSGELLRWLPLSNNKISATGLKRGVHAQLFNRAPFFGFARTNGYGTITYDEGDARQSQSLDLAPGVVAVLTLNQLQDGATVTAQIMLLNDEADFVEGPAFGIVGLVSSSPHVQLWLSDAVDPNYCVTAGYSVRSTATIAF